MSVSVSMDRRESMDRRPGVEGKNVLKGSRKGQTIAIFTSGGDSQGMNAAVRACVRMGIFLGCKVYLIKEGYQGMVDGGDNFVHADWKSVSGMLNLGGTVIGSARCMDFVERSGRLKAANNLIQRGINNLICIGGDGSLTGANCFRQEWTSLLAELIKENKVTPDKANFFNHLNVSGVVGSIDNDFCGTDMTIGTDSALHRIIEGVDNIESTATSHQRCFILEVMGRNCGFLAVAAALAAEADWMFVPEWPPEKGWEDKMCERLCQMRDLGQRMNIIIISEGAIDREGKPISANQVKELIVMRVKLDTRVTILGHIQRGGNPSAYDRILASRMGAEAVLSLMEATQDSVPQVVAIDGNQIVRVPLIEAVQRTKSVKTAMDDKDFTTAVKVRGRSFQQNLSTYLLLAKVSPPTKLIDPKGKAKNFVLGVMCLGSPACGMNAAVRTFVRVCVANGYNVYSIHHGFEGLMQNHVEHMKWEDVCGWSSIGGTNIGTSTVLLDQFGVEKVAAQMRKFKIAALLLIGGYEAFYSALVMAETRNRNPEFCIPITVIPSTISNDVPGTDFSLGSDTALNEITDMCDRLRQSAIGSKNRVFICETMGGHCGYLATMSALASGADAAYIYEEAYGIRELMTDVVHLAAKIKSGIRRGLILKSDKSDDVYTIDFIHRLYSHEGKSTFSARLSVLGEIQEGGRPSPYDRLLGTRMATMCADKLISQLKECTSAAGVVNTVAAESCSLVGFQKRTVIFTPVQELKKKFDFQHRIPRENWWMKLRPLLRILAKHDSIYQSESIEGKAKDVDDKVTK